ncbi:transcriptional regulator [Metamycoplasma phocicerebrale]|uniref:Transcriptional regulator n=1 Tax=Metamycoplasma phocicerebrale TaxID=142649 RepID=A0A3Q9V8P6_9BACT|nr:diacylglycerol kinase family protein [Metamycoplasma phocicerebrale]AZZ65208.1 transcriptional regulator [Metamycoplasma phocicerebrale]
MLYVLYNLLSKSGKNPRKLFNIVSKTVNTFKKDNLKVIDITKIQDYKKEIDNVKKEDTIVIIGGDGTLTHITDKLRHIKNLPDIYAYKAGTGNDFIRNIKATKEYKVIKRKFYRINEYLHKLPIIKSGNLERSFLNGAGFGLDAMIAKATNDKKNKDGKASFFKVSLDCVKKFKPMDNIKLTIDGKEYIFNKVSLISVMNGPYYGAGMKIAPKANIKKDYLSVTIISNIKTIKLLCVFSLVYSGLHTKVKSVTQLFGKNIKIENIPNNFSQIDGEIFETNNRIEIYKKNAD